MSLPLYRSEQRAISDVTRKEIFDYLRLSGTSYHGARSEIDFLDQLYNLDELPSFDGRSAYNTARKDIYQHMVNNRDWETIGSSATLGFNLRTVRTRCFWHSLQRRFTLWSATMLRQRNLQRNTMSCYGWTAGT